MSAFTTETQAFEVEICGVQGRHRAGEPASKRTITIRFDGVRPAINLDGDVIPMIEDAATYLLPRGAKVKVVRRI